LNLGLLVPEADAMSTAPRRQGEIFKFLMFEFLIGSTIFWTTTPARVSRLI
jgi:hypothetical protein